MMSQFSNMTSTPNFDVVLFLLSSLVPGQSFMSISSLVLELRHFLFKRDLPEILKSEIPRLSFATIWRLEWVKNTKFGTNVSNGMSLNAAKLLSYSFYRFWVIKGKPNWGEGKITPPLPRTPRLGLEISKKAIFFFKNNQKSRKTCPLLLTMGIFCFLWKLPLFSTPVHVSHIKWRPKVLKWISFIFLVHFPLD